jgi:hypothetical protein
MQNQLRGRFTIKQLEKTKKAIKLKLDKLNASDKKGRFNYF